MIFQLHSDNSNFKKLIAHLKWLQDLGVINSFELKESDQQYLNQDSKDILNNMLKEGEADYKNGNTFSPEEVKSMIDTWLKDQR